VLALTDSGLAYIVLAAARMPTYQRDRWPALTVFVHQRSFGGFVELPIGLSH
jgi:hypothetical protein